MAVVVGPELVGPIGTGLDPHDGAALGAQRRSQLVDLAKDGACRCAFALKTGLGVVVLQIHDDKGRGRGIELVIGVEHPLAGQHAFFNPGFKLHGVVVS